MSDTAWTSDERPPDGIWFARDQENVIIVKTEAGHVTDRIALNPNRVGALQAFLSDALTADFGEPATPGGRTVDDAAAETERILRETMDRWHEDASAEWMLTRVTKAAEALADRPRRLGAPRRPLA